MKLEELSKTIDAVFESNKEARSRNDFIKLLENGFECLGFVNRLTNIAIDNEREYRKFEAITLLELKQQGNKGKNGEAETRAKATDHYINMIHEHKLIELCHEMNNNAKKLADSLNNELKALGSNNRQHG